MVSNFLYRVKNKICKIVNVVRFRLDGVEIGSNCVITGIIHVLNKGGKIKIGNDVTIHSGRYDIPIGFENRTSLWVRKGAEIEIGDNCGLSNAVLCSNKRIILGKHVLLGGGVKIYDTDFHSIKYGKFFVVRPERFELPTHRFVACCSIQLSYERIKQQSNLFPS